MSSAGPGVAIRPLTSLPPDCLEDFFIDPDGIFNSMTLIQVIHPKDFSCLPQNFVSAMTASVPLTAIQITDADLLKREESKRLNWLKSPNINNIKFLSLEVVMRFKSHKSVIGIFQIAEIIQVFLAVASCRTLLCPSVSLLVKWYPKLSCLSWHSKESFAVKDCFDITVPRRCKASQSFWQLDKPTPILKVSAF